ncbi:MAG TPA: tRNA adenosine(34) deaminase TadA [Actinomycetota bacterium]|nr:tRNA adenosine(34) deaminase TadA [Actinomycetota bacterium]
MDDIGFMQEALHEALLAPGHGDVPVGAVLVRDGRIVSRGRNDRELRGRPDGHAELVAIQAAADALGTWRLSGCTLYVTLEPCPMCAGAIVAARLDRLVFGAWDPKAGACGSLYNIVEDPRLNHRVEVTRGVMADACAAPLLGFFSQRRGGSGGGGI